MIRRYAALDLVSISMQVTMTTTSVAVREFPLEEEYRKPTGVTPQDVSKLREWLQTQPHLPGEHITDLDLILAYNCCNRSIEVSKQLLDTHFTTRTLFTNFFKDRVMDDKMEFVGHKYLAKPLSTRTKEGYVIIYAHFIDNDPEHFVVADILRFLLMVIDLWQYEDGTWPGFVLLADLQNMTFGHVAKLDFPILQQLFYYVQNAILLNLKAIHVINAPPFFDVILSLVKPLLKKSLLDVLNVHTGGVETLDKDFPREDVPKEAGESNKTVGECKDEVLAKLKANQEFFVKENRKRVVEELRPGKPKTISDIFDSVEGSFKQLEVD